MKKGLVRFLALLLVSMSTLYAQSFNDYVSAMRGDTAVIKDFGEKNESSTLTQAVNLDTEAPAGRVYMLKKNGFYPLATNLSTPATRDIIIVGEDKTPLVANKDVNSAPPVICGSTIEGAGSNTGGINFGGNLTVANCSIIPAASDRTLGWSFFGDAAANVKLVLQNDIFEHTKWVMLNSNNDAGNSFFIKDCYFVNLSGQPCRRNGGVYDNVNNNTDTMWVENSTHVMAQGMLYKFRNFPVGKVFFNHNTFVNCSGNVIETLGYQSNMIVTNNIFVNSNVQPYYPTLDAGETDADNKPMGIINVRALTPDMPQLDRKIYVDKNVVYFDPRLDDMVATLNTQQINNRTDWASQAIKYNDRTKGMFDDNATYPYLTEGTWYEVKPSFKDPKDLLTDQVDALKEFSVKTVDTTSTNVMPDWRLVNDVNDYYVYSDWPIPVDLSYTETSLTGTDGLPVGDLNWFPTQKAAYVAQRAKFLGDLETALNTGVAVPTSVKPVVGPANEFKVGQNYPNPFNPTTSINFSLPKDGFVTVKVYNAIGQEVATLVNGFKKAHAYSVEFNASSLPSGVYVYQVQFDNNTVSKKMVLMK